MGKIFLSVAAGVLGLTLVAGTAEAGGRHGHGSHRGHSGHYRHGGHYSHRGHGRYHSVRFKGGHYYRGRSNHFWTRRVWDVRYRRYIYWNPVYSCYYYFYEPGDCYYPVSYCP